MFLGRITRAEGRQDTLQVFWEAHRSSELGKDRFSGGKAQNSKYIYCIGIIYFLLQRKDNM